jgi:hypothetical protein
LFYDTILTTKDDAHTTQVAYLGAAYDQGIDVETSASKNSRYAGENTRFILYETVENMSAERENSITKTRKKETSTF